MNYIELNREIEDDLNLNDNLPSSLNHIRDENNKNKSLMQFKKKYIDLFKEDMLYYFSSPETLLIIKVI